MEKINIAQICSITSFVNCINRQYEYRKEKKFLGFVLQKEGYYERLTFASPILKSKEEIEESGKYICKDNVVYYKPHIEIRTSDGCVHEKYFETERMLYEFVNYNHRMKEANFIDK